jgi:hypothetical protein
MAKKVKDYNDPRRPTGVITCSECNREYYRCAGCDTVLYPEFPDWSWATPYDNLHPSCTYLPCSHSVPSCDNCFEKLEEKLSEDMQQQNDSRR